MAFGKMGSRGGFGSLGALGKAGNSPKINLGGSSFAAGAAQGTAIGTLSVSGVTGSPTFTLASADPHVQIVGSALQVGPTVSSAGSFSITIHVTGVSPTITDTPFLITATGGVALKADFSDANANEAWVFQ
jgi:hypothetical protein